RKGLREMGSAFEEDDNDSRHWVTSQTLVQSTYQSTPEKEEHLKKRRLLKECRAVISHLSYEEELQSVKKRWLMRRWPEYLDSSRSSNKSPSQCGFLEDRYIRESLLRDDN
ncbi:hypothetical protein KI387_020498, partial [Taxus chinensis]